MTDEKKKKKAKTEVLIENFEYGDGDSNGYKPPSALLNAYFRPPNQIQAEDRKLMWGDTLYPDRETYYLQMDAVKIKQLLNDFLNLAEATDQEIEKFARRWGVIGQCAHGLPYHHLPLPPPRYPRYVRDHIARAKASFEARAKDVGARDIEKILKRRNEEFANTSKTDKDRKNTEFWVINDLASVEMKIESFLNLSLKHLTDVQLPRNGLCERVTDFCGSPVGDNLESYRHFAQEAFAIIELASDLREGKPGQKKHWERLLYNWDTSNRDEFELPKYVGKPGMQYSLSIIINHWLEMTGVRPGIFWFGEEPTFTLIGATSLSRYRPGENILAFVALQIMLLVTRRAGFGRCAYCGDWFDLESGQSVSRGCYCPEHQAEKYYNAISARMYRKRNRETPDRQKRTRLTTKEINNIRAKRKKTKMPLSEFCRQMAEQYQRSERRIRYILNSES